ncbi:ABSCISIC ACID-INSENSITIVE 5-like protein 5 [Apium graveolens]|uniref:ABSCISIC ACID-INSENSITIVE 5-like protein 5 n=1 Tax=Apium graveolens TaxID=4045 RepID=UPI003D7A0A38
MNMNFKNFENEPPGDGGGRLLGSLSLARQTSIYSLTFDELQSTIGGTAKDFGSMNMDELLKSIWSAEETQTHNVGTSSGVQEGGVAPGGYLQRQGSLTLPRTLSQKTVDEVWRGFSKDYGGGLKDGTGVSGGSKMPQAQRQPTLGEITLEEFLVKAGVVREDVQPVEKASTNNMFGNFLQSGNNSSFGIGFQQNGQNLGMMGSRTPSTTTQIAFQSPNLPLNVNGGRTGQQQLPTLQPQLQQRPQQQQQQQQLQQPQQQLQQPQQQLPQLFPKQNTLAYATPIMPIQSNGQLGSPVIRGGIMGISDNGTNGNLVQTSGLQGGGGLGMVGLGAGAVTVAMGSPAVSSDGIGKSNGDTSSVSPIPYLFNGGLRGRKNSAVEKVVERRQRRMIKNRESAARSRARKQAYTMELEAEIEKLKAENKELRQKQEKMEMQKNQDRSFKKDFQKENDCRDWQQELEVDHQQGAKRRCLRRTRTGPW